MRKALLFLCILFYGLSATGQNTIWVSNNPNDLEVVDYTTLSAALAAAGNGDTLFFYNSQQSYGSATIDKKIHLRGVGYDVDTSYQADLEVETFPHNPTFSELRFFAGSDGSSMEGLRLGGLRIEDSGDVIVRRCYPDKVRCWDSDNVVFQSNFIGSGYYGDGPTCSGQAYRVNMNVKNCNGVVINNNIFKDYYSNSCPADRQNLYVAQTNSGVLIKHNLFRDYVTISNSIIKNNIFLYWGTTSNYESSINNSIEFNTFCSSSTNIPLNNTIGVDCNALFLGGPSFDGQYQLAVGSPAAGQGEGGVDCGPFTGLDPYKRSGIHNRPLIYQFEVPNEVPMGNNIDVHIKVRAEN